MLRQLAALDAVDGQLAAGLPLAVEVVVLDRLGVFPALVQGLRQAEVDDAVRIVVADGVHVGAGRLGRAVDHPVALAHAEGDVAAQVPLLGRGFRVYFPVDGGRLIVFADPLFLLGVAQLGGLAGEEEGDQQAGPPERDMLSSHSISFLSLYDGKRGSPPFIASEQQRAVAVAQEAEVVPERVVVDPPPVAFHEGGDQEQQRAPRLVEVGDDPFHQLELVARGDDDPRRRHQAVGAPAVEVIQDVPQRLGHGQAVVGLVIRHPLPHDQFLARGIRIILDEHADVVEALERADRGGADGDDLAQVGPQPFDRRAADGDEFRVHLVAGDRLALHRLEGAGAHVQRHLLAADAVGVDVGQHLGREVQPGGRGGDRSLDLGIDGLVGAQVAFLRLPVQVGRDGQDASRVEQLGERHPVVVPRELNQVRVAF